MPPKGWKGKYSSDKGKTKLINFRIDEDLANKIYFYQEHLGINLTEVCTAGLIAGLDSLETELIARQAKVKALADAFDCGILNLKAEKGELEVC